MEENPDGRRKRGPSIPSNYLSILQLQQQWIKEKERRQKEREEEEEDRKRSQRLEEQRRREEDREKIEAEKQLKEVGKGVERRKLDEKGVDLRNRRLSSRNLWRKEPGVGGEAIRDETVESAAMAIVSENGEETTPDGERLREVRRKKKKSRMRKKNQAKAKVDLSRGERCAPLLNKPIQVNNEIRGVCKPKPEKATGAPHRENASKDLMAKIEKEVEHITIGGRVGGERCAPLLNKPIPVKNEIRGVCKPKPEKATGAPHRENASKDLMAEIEKEVKHITIGGRVGGGDTRTSKSSERLSRRNHSNLGNNRHHQRSSRQSLLTEPKFVWVKKEQAEGDAGGNGTASL